MVMALFPGEENVYYSADSVSEEHHSSIYPVEFLNSLSPSGLSPHKLTLKVCVLFLCVLKITIIKFRYNYF